ncbi:hypothetical protein D3C72_1765460 [compost metagenome]
MANTTPASGVLNAAASPPAAPAAIRALGWKPMRKRSFSWHQRPHASMAAAPTCTDGPSRPTDAPASNASVVSNTFHIDCRNDTSAVCAGPLGGSVNAAITCGMPLPRACGAKRIVSQRSAARPNGSITKASHGVACVRLWFQRSATSAIHANTSENRPTQPAPNMKTV